jgi:hypothetical protein
MRTSAGTSRVTRNRKATKGEDRHWVTRSQILIHLADDAYKARFNQELRYPWYWVALLSCDITGSLAAGHNLLEEEVALHRYHGSESTVRCTVYNDSENMHGS